MREVTRLAHVGEGVQLPTFFGSRIVRGRVTKIDFLKRMVTLASLEGQGHEPLERDGRVGTLRQRRVACRSMNTAVAVAARTLRCWCATAGLWPARTVAARWWTSCCLLPLCRVGSRQGSQDTPAAAARSAVLPRLAPKKALAGVGDPRDYASLRPIASPTRHEGGSLVCRGSSLGMPS